MSGAAAARRRHIDLGSRRRLHLIDAGDGPPALFLHGTGTSALSFLPLIEQLDGVRRLAVDRPGFGLSDPVLLLRERFRAAAVEFVDEVLDALKLETVALAGNSMGGTWALWYALERPDRVRRLVLLGASPLLPGTRAPTPIRIMAAPAIGDAPSRVKTNEKMIVRFMASMGEKDTIVGYPALIRALVAAAADPVASNANLAELRAAISPLGFRRLLRLQRDELRLLTVPALLIWGDRDPVGAVEVGRDGEARPRGRARGATRGARPVSRPSRARCAAAVRVRPRRKR